MKRILSIVIGLMLTLPSFADGLQYLGHCKSLYNSGRYEEAKQGFTLCKVYDDIDDAEMDVWIARCENAITTKKNKAAAAARKAEAEREEKGLVFISTNARTITADYTSMHSAIKGNLQTFSFAKKENESKWGVYVTANAREYSNPNTNSVGAYIIYVDAVCQVIDLITGAIVFEQEYSQKKGLANRSKAVELAYKDLVTIISNDIRNTLTQPE